MTLSASLSIEIDLRPCLFGTERLRTDATSVCKENEAIGGPGLLSAASFSRIWLLHT